MSLIKPVSLKPINLKLLHNSNPELCDRVRQFNRKREASSIYNLYINTKTLELFYLKTLHLDNSRSLVKNHKDVKVTLDKLRTYIEKIEALPDGVELHGNICDLVTKTYVPVSKVRVKTYNSLVEERKTLMKELRTLEAELTKQKSEQKSVQDALMQAETELLRIIKGKIEKDGALEASELLVIKKLMAK